MCLLIRSLFLNCDSHQFWRPSSHHFLFLISSLLLVFLSWARLAREKGNMKFIKLFSGSNMRLTEDILLWYTAISNAVLLDFINKATRAAIFKLSPGFHSAQHRDTRRETRERFISRQIIRQNSSSDLYLDGLSVWRMIRLAEWSVSSINRANDVRKIRISLQAKNSRFPLTRVTSTWTNQLGI